MRASNTRCEHGFDWRVTCPQGCGSYVTTELHNEFEVCCDFGSATVWMSFDTLEAARAWMADPWKSFPGRANATDFGPARMTLYTRVVAPWESLEELSDHEGWHHTPETSGPQQ